MYLRDWKEQEEDRIGFRITYSWLANKFDVKGATIVRRWMLPAYHRDFKFPSTSNILKVQAETFGEVQPTDWYNWLEETKTEPKIEEKIEEKKTDTEEFQENYLCEEEIAKKEEFKDHYLISVKEASFYLFGSRDRKHQQKVLRLAHNGVLKHIRSGKRFYFNRKILSEVGL